MKFLGHYLVDSGSSWFENLYSMYEITIQTKSVSFLEKFVSEKITAKISDKKDWVYSDDGKNVTLLIGWPSGFEELTELRNYTKKLQNK